MDARADRTVWWETSGREDYGAETVARRDALADAARNGAWALVRPELAEHPEWINAPRLGSRSGYTPLHQAAWHGADAEIVRMLGAGGLRTARTADGDRPVDIARSRGHHELVPLLDVEAPTFPRGWAGPAIETYLHALMVVRARRFGIDRPLRLPPVDAVVELAGRPLWCPVSGMYGGFSLTWEGEAVAAASWQRISGGSGQRHRVSVDGVELVEEGFV